MNSAPDSIHAYPVSPLILYENNFDGVGIVGKEPVHWQHLGMEGWKHVK
jgi:hypothetical protein